MLFRSHSVLSRSVTQTFAVRPVIGCRNRIHSRAIGRSQNDPRVIVFERREQLILHLLRHAGLALSIGLGATFNAFFLFLMLRKNKIYQPESGWPLFIIQILGALFILAGVGLWMGSQFDWIALHSAPWTRIGLLFLIVLICVACYFIALLAMGLRLSDFKRESV